ncbi:nucleotidyltransferase [Streptosporangium jomthongense]|uniref:Nucleotidyltransferase n=1 Tax=Streptosporangium jomthongense TaxID=1193683 RepID=A0ABV8F1C0_9ACTN
MTVTEHAPTAALVDRFVTGLVPMVPLLAVWAHGSLAAGDYQPGRSDLDLVAVLSRPCSPEEKSGLTLMHERLGAAVPLAAKLHCGYVVTTELDDPARPHLAWAHEEVTHRPITPVTRRELHEFGLVLYGPPPATLLPPVTDEELAGFVAWDLREFWRPLLDRPDLWLRDIWVDAAMLTLARATVTLREGRLVTKHRALAVLREMGAPTRIVDDIERRRYARPGPVQDDGWPTLRAELTVAFLASEIDAVSGRSRA